MAIRNIRHRLKDIAPPRLQTTMGFRVLYTIAVVADATIELALQGTLSRFPGVGTPTALSTIGRDRLIPRGASESDDAYAARLVAWRDAHRRAGSAYLEMEQVQAYHVDPSYLQLVNSHSCWYVLDKQGNRTRTLADPTNWDWDGLMADLPSRFWLIIYPNPSLFWRDLTWANTDGSTWGDDPEATWGSTATRSQVADIRGLMEHWRSAGGLLEHILIGFADLPLDPNDTNPPLPDGQWGYHSKLDAAGNCVRARSADFIYWRGQAS